MEGKVGTRSQISELIESQERLTTDLEEMRVTLATRDAEISHLKAKVQQLSTKRVGATDVLKARVITSSLGSQ